MAITMTAIAGDSRMSAVTAMRMSAIRRDTRSHLPLPRSSFRSIFDPLPWSRCGDDPREDEEQIARPPHEQVGVCYRQDKHHPPADVERGGAHTQRVGP